MMLYSDRISKVWVEDIFIVAYLINKYPSIELDIKTPK